MEGGDAFNVYLGEARAPFKLHIDTTRMGTSSQSSGHASFVHHRHSFLVDQASIYLSCVLLRTFPFPYENTDLRTVR